MKILFINPNLYVDKDFIDYPYFVNLGMLQSISILKNQGHKVLVIDAFSQNDSDVTVIKQKLMFGSNSDFKEKFDKAIKEKFDAVIILNSPFLKLFCSERNRDVEEILKKLKSKMNNPKIILADCYIGGMHYIDYDVGNIIQKYPLIDKIYKQECEIQFLNFNNPDEINQKQFLNKLDTLPYPDYDSISINNYQNFLWRISKKGYSDFMMMDKYTLPFFTSRGCVYNCSFCTSRLNNRVYRVHSLEYLKKQITFLKKKYNVKKIILLDDLLNPNKRRLDLLLTLLKNLNISYEIPNGLRADNISTYALNKIKQNNCVLSISAESGCQNIIDNVLKKDLNLIHVKDIAKKCHELKIPLLVHFIIGSYGENLNEINKTLSFSLELYDLYNIIPKIQAFVPIPGSVLFKKLNIKEPELQILLDNYNKYFLKGSNYCSIEQEKIIQLLKNFNERINKTKSEKLIINTTYKCNNNCIFCSTAKWRKRIPSLELQKKQLKIAREKGISQVDFDGGEPTLYDHLFELLDYAKKLGFKQMHITTNGRMLSHRKNVEKLIKKGITSLLFSLHGYNEEIHDEITRVPGSFGQTMKGIKNAIEFNKILDSKIDLGVNITINNKNLTELEKFFALLLKIGIQKINIQFITPFGNANKNQVPKRDEIMQIIPGIIEKYSQKIKIQIANLPFCYLKGYEKYMYDNFLKSQRDMVFIGQEKQNLAKFLATKRYKDDLCYSCVHNITCSGFWDFN